MKHLFVILPLSLSVSFQVWASSPNCRAALSASSSSQLEQHVADDCFQKYVQDSVRDSNITYIGYSCDHSGDYQFKFYTQPAGSSCQILKSEIKQK